jgi:pyrroloquinoline-quinone synthase
VTTALAAPDRPWTPDEFEARLRAVAQERYHDRHPFNLRMHEGDLTPAEVRRWIANRFHYQRHIPVKDALITAKLDSARLRRMWLRRIEDHDGRDEGEGGIERWLRLGEAAGLDRGSLLAGDSVLPGVRLAVEGYVNFCRLRPPLEAVAASLTELSAPDLMRLRIGAFERHYPWIEASGLDYFRGRVDQGRRDSTEALGLVLQWARTREEQQRAVAALTFKCDVLWALLDAVQQPGSSDGDGHRAVDSRPWRESGAEAGSRPWRDGGPDAESRFAARSGGPGVDSRPWRDGGHPEAEHRPWRDGGPEADCRPSRESGAEVDSRPWRTGGPAVESCASSGGGPGADSRPWRAGRRGQV